MSTELAEVGKLVRHYFTLLLARTNKGYPSTTSDMRDELASMETILAKVGEELAATTLACSVFETTLKRLEAKINSLDSALLSK